MAVYSEDTHAREIDFHDAWAMETAVEDIDVFNFATAPTALENRKILDFLGNISTKRILDVGCGLGEASVFFAKLGAEVTAADIAPEAVAKTRELALHHAVKINTEVASGESLPFNNECFDVVYGGSMIHHLTDIGGFCAEVNRVLRAGGRFCCFEPLKYNPAINYYRRIATKVRSKDEKPLGIAEVNAVRNAFGKSEVYFCWLAALGLFLKYYFIDRVSPNKERYWKKILRETESSLAWWRPLLYLDEKILTRIPGVRWLSWNIVVLCEK